jgi:hypothetical protein
MAVKFDKKEKLEEYLRSLDRRPVVVPPAAQERPKSSTEKH